MIAAQLGDILQGRAGVIFAPINVGSWGSAALSAPSHWILAIIDTVARRVVTMDSFRNSYKKEVSFIRKRIQRVSRDLWPVGPTWKVQIIVTGMQPDSNSCGLAVAASAHAYASVSTGCTWLSDQSAVWRDLRVAAQGHMSLRVQSHPGSGFVELVPMDACPFTEALDSCRDTRSVRNNVLGARSLPKVLPGGVLPEIVPPKAAPVFAEPSTLLEWDITPVVAA